MLTFASDIARAGAAPNSASRTQGSCSVAGAVGAGAGLGAGFFFFLAGVAFFIPFFLRAGAPRFAFLDFFATFNLPIGLTKIMQYGTTP